MENFNYRKICQDLLKDLPQRQKEVISRRFGFKSGRRETLEAIGEDFGITRERVRQIQEDAFRKIREKTGRYKNVFLYFESYFKKFGGLRREDVLLKELGKSKWENEVYFLLTVGGTFARFVEKDDFYSYWTVTPDSLSRVKEFISSLAEKLKGIGKPLPLKDLRLFVEKKSILTSYLEISKIIQKNEDGLYGLNDWPEINPRGIRDKAYIIFKKINKPLHFTKVAELIEGANVQTVHNELIRDSRFVLVGRGTYALQEWGYEPGQVKDVITKILKEKGPMTKEEILNEVSKQRLVKRNTILLNLSNKKYFLRDTRGRYKLRIQIA